MLRQPLRALKPRTLAVGLGLLAHAALAEGDAHLDPVAPVALALAVILLAAKVGGDLAVRLKQPAVLGELLVGVLLGNLALLGFPHLESYKADAALDLLARLGVVVLLFEVGLESTVRQMLQVGLRSLAVAVVGVVLPFALGWAVGAWLLPTHGAAVHAFLGATLSATSVGITARVLKDLDRSQTTESRIILGAAVIDDVLGLVILAVVAGAIGAADRGESLGVGEIGLVVVKALGFLGSSLLLGTWLSPRLFHVASRLRATGVLLAVALAFCFLLAAAAQAVGLAPIVGAFAAGLILEDTHFAELATKEHHSLDSLIHPIGAFLSPVFFVLMGMRADVRQFQDAQVLLLALVLTVVAIAGKVLAGAGAYGKGIDRLTVGLGMVPRGEVGLIFANVGLSLTLKGEPVVSAATYGAVLFTVLATTLVTPPALRWSLARRGPKVALR